MSAPNTIKDGYSLLVRKIAATRNDVIGWSHIRSIFREMGALGLLDFDPETISRREYAEMAAEVRAERDGSTAPKKTAKKPAAPAPLTDSEGGEHD